MNVDNKDKHFGRHFQIACNPIRGEYSILDLGIGFGVFFQVFRPVPLLPLDTINIGNTYILVKRIRDEEKVIELEINGKSVKTFKYVSPLLKSEKGNKISIGRHRNCDIIIKKDNMLSKR